ncbi:alpha/beta hydrolase [Pseudonocardia sp. K10HN5]|uniref:Alpha/beta hydrolase n=1 Tax=Pseudonocardia acidicola TaxID=2724939 RepID=A0ABX1S8X7_9PSEU|nr:alpha/beta hydrolase [Pseudonocardia acidicola]
MPMGIEVWSESVNALSRHGRVVAFDKLGQGWTDLPPDDEHWTFESVLEHARSFIEQLELNDITVVGHSRGGLLATRLAIDLPDRVSRLVVVSSATTAPTPPGQSDMGFYDNVEATAPTDAGAEGVISHYHSAQAVTEGPLSPEYLRIAAEMMEGSNHKESVDGYARNSEEYWIPSLVRAKQQTLDHLEGPGLAVPVLVVWGKDDRSAPVELGHQFFEILSRKTANCSMYIINRAGHQVFRDQPKAFNGVVVGFLNT